MSGVQSIVTATATTAALVAAQADGAQVAVTDSAFNVVANLDSLESVAAAGELSSIALTDSGFAILSITAAQLTADAAVLTHISGNFVLQESAAVANVTIAGLPGHGNTVVFSGLSNEYSGTVPTSGDSFVVTDTSTGRASSDTLSNITALQFSDQLFFVAAEPGTTTVTTGNVTELYAAVLDRTPDVPGLAYYENVLIANPSTPLIVFAEWFLQSPEYTAAHNYPQTSAGDAQFVADSYNNLLHRAPEAGAVAWYQSNIMASFLAGVTPGTAAFTAAELSAHAAVLADFNRLSSEG